MPPSSPPPEPITLPKQRYNPQAANPSPSQSASRSFGGPRSTSTPTSAVPRPVRSSPAINSDKPGSVKNIAAKFEVTSNGKPPQAVQAARPHFGIRSASATVSGLPRPKTPTSRTPDNVKSPSEQRNRLHKSPPPSRIPTDTSKIQRKPAQVNTAVNGDLNSSTSRIQRRPVPSVSALPPRSEKLFGEIDASSDGTYLIGHGIPRQKNRRGSDSNIRYITPPLLSTPFADFQQSTSARQGSPHQRSQSDMAAFAGAQKPMGISALPQVLQPDVWQDVAAAQRRKISRIPAPSSGSTLQPVAYGGQPTSTSSRGADDQHQRPQTPPSPASFSPLNALPRGPDQRLRAMIKDNSPQKSPPLRSSRPRQQITSANGSSAGNSFQSGSPERHMPGAFRDSFIEGSQASQGSQSIPSSRDGSNNYTQQDSIPTFDGTQNGGLLLPQLSNAVYQKFERPTLTVDSAQADAGRAHTPGSLTDFEENATDFEDEDTPLSATRTEFHIDDEIEPPVQSDNEPAPAQGHQPTSSFEQPPIVDRRSPPQGLSIQTTQIEHQPPPGFIPHRPQEASPALSQKEDTSWTIDIVLDPTSVYLPPPSTTSHQDAHRSFATPTYRSPMTPLEDDSKFMVPRQNAAPRVTLDSDGYQIYHNILDSYIQSGDADSGLYDDLDSHTVSSDYMTREQLSRIFIGQASVLSRQRSQVSHTPNIAELPADSWDRHVMQWNGLPSSQADRGRNEFFTTGSEASASRSAPSSTQIGSEVETASTVTPMPNNRASSQTLHSVASEHPSLPEIQDTGGGLGLLHADAPQPSPLLDTVRTGNISRSTDSSLGSAQIYPRSIDSHQAASGQQETPETPASTVSRPHSFRSTEMSSRKPSVDQNPASSSDRDRLVTRQKIIQELIDTEYAYHQDMTVLEDIYMATATSCEDLTPRDITTLFGNTSDMEKFSRDFADDLRHATKGVYFRSRSGKWAMRRKELDRESSVSTASGGRNEPPRDGPDEDADRLSNVGSVINRHLIRMEKVYTDFLRNADNANEILKQLKTKSKAQLWMSECHEYAKDLTEAWSLDALIIKPTQRITRYPLLLGELLKRTPEDHPDRQNLEVARAGTMAVTERINTSKKRSELIVTASSSDSKKPFFKITGWTERTRQKMGKSEGFEDLDYNEALSKFSTETHKVSFVLRDFQYHLDQNEVLMTAFSALIRVLEELVEIKHSPYPELESKWRRYIMIVRELLAIGYPDHVRRLQASCIQPLKTLLEHYKNADKLTKARKEHLGDYVRWRKLKEKGEKIDKKTNESGERFEAINDTLKTEFPVLREKTKNLVESCLASFANHTGRWYTFWKDKMKPVLDDHSWERPWETFVQHHREDFREIEQQVEILTARNKHLLQGTADFFSQSSSARASSLASQSSPGMQTPEVFPRASTSSASPPVSATYLPRPSTDSSRQQHSRAVHQRMRSRSQGNQPGARPHLGPLPPVPSNEGTFFVGNTPPAHTQEPASYEAAGAASRQYAHQRPSSSQAPLPRRPVQPSANQFASRQSPRLGNGRGVFESALPMENSPVEERPKRTRVNSEHREYEVQFLAASLFDFTIDRTRQEAGYPYLTYVPGEVFDVIGTKGELWLAKNQDDRSNTIGWIWEKHFAKLMADEDYGPVENNPFRS